MKKLIVLLFLSINVFSQVDVHIISITPDTICFNDTIHVKYHIDSAAVVNFPNGKANLSDSTEGISINNGWTFQHLSTTNYVYTLIIYSGDLSVGNHKLWTSSGLGNGKAVNLYVKNCILGIDNYNSKEDLISTEYFNLLGQPIKQPEGVTVEIKTYKGGQREVRKIISQ